MESTFSRCCHATPSAVCRPSMTGRLAARLSVQKGAQAPLCESQAVPRGSVVVANSGIPRGFDRGVRNAVGDVCEFVTEGDATKAKGLSPEDFKRVHAHAYPRAPPALTRLMLARRVPKVPASGGRNPQRPT